ncbi:MAG: glycosyltransferase [Bacteroidota bacterium]|nr:glycosyltransferase [Bacteroidota bacterium]
MRKQKIVCFDETPNKEANNVSVVYLTQNYAEGLQSKISFLLDEISCFENSELIVIDDASTDETVELLQRFTNCKTRVVTKENSKGIPHSMNLGVKLSTYQNIVFCDQRQILEKGIIKKLIDPLKYDEVGMVSSCISSYDKMNKFNFLRAYENFIKELEGKTGNLIGVYGPLYTIKKECYHEIPNNIILDDLYLTLSILNNKKVLFIKDCKTIDDNFDLLYSYTRSKRYLSGFFQILNEKELISKLSGRQKAMLFWHKYFRIPIPIFIASCYFYLGLDSFYNQNSFLLFLVFSILCISVLLPINLKIFKPIRSVVRLVSFYSLASIELFFRSLILKQNIYEK